MKLIKFFFIVIILFLHSCSEIDNNNYKEQLSDPELFQAAMQNLTDIVVYDIFSPPVASRVYLYPSVAAYEIMAHFNSNNFNSLKGQINELKAIPIPDNPNIDYNLAAIFSFNQVGKALIFSEKKMKRFEKTFDNKIKDFGVPNKVLTASKEYAQKVSKSILEWASKDMYSQTRTYPKYSIIEGDRFWKPTPPDYMDGIEPHWPKIRTMVLDSSNQFPPKDPIPFDLKKGSPFYKQLMEVYDITKSLTEEQTNIAKFWDCNPYVSHHKGHAMFATKKITPGGHWIGITAVATRKAKSSFEDTINAYVNVSITLFDAFISCWDEKWETLVVRPETLINQYYDEDWIPLLQTPPFPEYTSGHSVISRAAALTLTDLFGENFNFVDTTEVSYGLPSRSYKSFINASEEAAISRLYGGIHYMMAITEGVTQGQNIGNFIVKNIQTKKCL